MTDGSPTLEVGFEIDTGSSFDAIGQLENGMDRATANILAEAAKVEKATGGMVKLGGATAQISGFGNASTRAMRDAARETQRAERAGESLLRQISRQNAAFGKTKEELRRMRVEERALAAERVGNSDLARRLREEEAELWGKEYFAARQAAIARQNAAEDAAEAEVRAQAAVISQLKERARLEAAIGQNTGVGRVAATDSGATFSALAAQAAEQEARAKDKATIASKRLADEHARLAALVRGSHDEQVANAAAAERMRQSTDPLYAATARLNAEIAESTRLYYAGATAPAEYARQQTVLQQRLEQTTRLHNAAAVSARRNGFALTQLSFQVNDVATMAAMGAPMMQIFATQAGQIFQVFQMAEGGAAGLTKQIGGLLVRFAPLIAGVAAVAAGFALFNRAVSDVDTEPMIESLGLTRAEAKRLQNTTVGMGDTMIATFQVIAERVGIDTAAIKGFFGDAMDFLTVAGRNTLAGLYSAFVGTFRAIGAIVQGVWEGKGVGEILSDVGSSYKDSFDEANASLIQFGEEVNARISSNKLADLRKQAEEIKKDRTDSTSKADRHAERLQREAEAIEAQIRNLYSLGDAYRASGAEALIAEARVKAESDAIKKRADITEMVERQIRLAIAERVSDAAKAAAAVREQVEAQREVNALVEAGLVPSERASELVQDQLADLPLLAALQVAQQRGYADEIRRATQALEDQREVREKQREEEARAAFNSAWAGGESRLAELREEIRLIGASEAARVRALAIVRATNEARNGHFSPEKTEEYIAQQVEIAETQLELTQKQAAYNQELRFTADLLDAIDENARNAARGMSDAFGSVGDAMGQTLTIITGYHATDQRLREERKAQIEAAGHSEAAIARENHLYALRSASLQVGAFGDMAAAAKGFFRERTTGFQAMAAAEKAFRAVEFALSVRAIAQDAVETGSKIANTVARTAASAAEAVARAIASLPFPANLAAGAATAAALASFGISLVGSIGGGRGGQLEEPNNGTGTVLGDVNAQSQSIKRSIDALKEVDLLMLNTSREMAASLRSIERQIGGVAALVVRAGNVNADLGITEGFSKDLTGKLLEGIITGGGLLTKIPVLGSILGGIGGLVGSLFGSKTKVTASGIYGGPQSLGSILAGGFDASYFSDIEKTKKFLGVSTGKSRSTQFTAADAGLEAQFTLILREFSNAIAAAADPLGVATDEIARRLNGFVINIGKIDLKGLTGAEIEEKLAGVFGAAADRMAKAAFPGIERFQQVGEGAFETLVRVASTVEAVTASLNLLGDSASALGIDAKMALAEQFEDIGRLTSATQTYFERFYTAQEQAAARSAQLEGVFTSLGLSMPSTLAGFRQLVEAQDLTSAAGRETYAMLLQLAPAFADLQAAMNGARSAADILAERADLERRLLELQGDTAALRELELAKLDESNRALQLQIWALQDAQEAARAADELRKAWSNIGSSIEDEVRRIRGLEGPNGEGSFASLMGQFNAATQAARSGDQEAAQSLPGLSQALLRAAALSATSRQELDRIHAQTAASLEQTMRLINNMAGGAGQTPEALIAAIGQTQGGAPAAGANDNPAVAFRNGLDELREEVSQLRADARAGLAAVAGNTGRVAKKLDDVTSASGGDAISTVAAA